MKIINFFMFVNLVVVSCQLSACTFIFYNDHSKKILLTESGKNKAKIINPGESAEIIGAILDDIDADIHIYTESAKPNQFELAYRIREAECADFIPVLYFSDVQKLYNLESSIKNPSVINLYSVFKYYTQDECNSVK